MIPNWLKSSKDENITTASPAEGKTPSKLGALSRTLNYMQWYGSSSRTLGSGEYLFIVITLRSTMPWSGSAC